MEDLDYISSSPDLQPIKREVKPQDETDLSTLQRVLALCDRDIALYSSTDGLSVDETIFTVKQQLALNQRSVMRAREQKSLLEKTINDIKEKYEDG